MVTVDADTYIYSKDSRNTVHVIETTHNFPDYSVEPRAQTTACYNTCVHFLRFKIDLRSIEVYVSNMNMI